MAIMSDSVWSRGDIVRGFAQSPPNQALLQFASRELRRGASVMRALDIGCGAARNALPLAASGWHVVGVDNSIPMIRAARERVANERAKSRLRLALSTMTEVPLRSACCDLVIAHGCWNLARSSGEFRAAVAEAARVAKPDAGLFVFTFSRNTLPPDAAPVSGEHWVFTQFSGQPQCFLTAEELVSELAAAGFISDSAVPLIEHNRRRDGELVASTTPVIYEGAFRRTHGD
jgi:SAM-dependent methyltransferase